MDDPAPRDSFWQRRRARRVRRAADRRALTSEFELDRPRGFARLRALAAEMGDLESERIRSHSRPPRQAARTPERRAERAR
ncbi:MAG TPA: hypothetical protein VG295_02810 [Solirubrobacteraceae bacterium]|nr:hypothetical protein [Solirubrobacteraceae bacterium]